MILTPEFFALVFGDYIAQKRTKEQRQKGLNLTKPFVFDGWVIASDMTEFIGINKSVFNFDGLPKELFSKQFPETGISVMPKGEDNITIGVKRLTAFVDSALKTGYDMVYNIGCDFNYIRECVARKPLTCSCVDRSVYRKDKALVNIYGNMFFAYQLRHLLKTCEIFSVEHIGLKYATMIPNPTGNATIKMNPHRFTLLDGVIVMFGFIPTDEPFN